MDAAIVLGRRRTPGVPLHGVVLDRHGEQALFRGGLSGSLWLVRPEGWSRFVASAPSLTAFEVAVALRRAGLALAVLSRLLLFCWLPGRLLRGWSEWTV